MSVNDLFRLIRKNTFIIKFNFKTLSWVCYNLFEDQFKPRKKFLIIFEQVPCHHINHKQIDLLDWSEKTLSSSNSIQSLFLGFVIIFLKINSNPRKRFCQYFWRKALSSYQSNQSNQSIKQKPNEIINQSINQNWSNQPIDQSINQIKSIKSIKSINESIKSIIESIKSINDSIKSINQINQPNQSNQWNQINENNQSNQSNNQINQPINQSISQSFLSFFESVLIHLGIDLIRPCNRTTQLWHNLGGKANLRLVLIFF